MVDPSGAYTYTYDLRDRLLQKMVDWNNGPSNSLNYAYDPDGDVTNIFSGAPNGVNMIYAYDPLNRLTNVIADGNACAAYIYDFAGNLQTMRYGNDVTNLYQYDSLNCLTNAVWKLSLTPLANFSYLLGYTGTRTNLNEYVGGTNRLYTWQYDRLYRLTNENESGSSSPSGDLFYQYDPVGNRSNRSSTSGLTFLTNQVFSFNTNDWLSTDKYDNNGNTTNSANTLYQYDVMNHLTNAGGIVMTYDGDGNRVSKTVAGTTTYYLVDAVNPSGYAQVLEEWTNNGTTGLSKVYNYGLDLISQRLPNTSTNYFIYDGHGSTRMLTDIGGNVVNIIAYDAYGNLIASNGVLQAAYLYSGQQYDFDLGLYYNRSRLLNPNTGRFWTADTTDGNNEDPLSLHKYLYAQDDPVDGEDPSGNDDIGDLTAVMDVSAGLDGFALPAISQVLQGHTRTVTIQSYISAASVWGFAGDNHGEVPTPSTHFRTSCTITFNDGNPSIPPKVTADTGTTRRISSGKTAKASPAGLKAVEKWEGPGDVQVIMMGKAKDPITPQWITPSVDYMLELNIDFNAGTYNGGLWHNLFPSFEVFIDNRPIYNFAEIGGPANLFFEQNDLIYGDTP